MSANCPNHSGHTEKMNGISNSIDTTKWIISILITILIAVNGSFLTYLWKMNSELSGITAKSVMYDKVLESKLEKISDLK